MASRNRPPKSFSGNHQRSWLWGKHAVLETLACGQWPVLEVLATAEAIDQSTQLIRQAKTRGIEVQLATAGRLKELSKAPDHQGMIARLGAYAYGTVEQLPDLIAQRNAARPPLMVMCDRIQDSFNFGAILRSCNCASVTAVIVGQREQAAMTPHVIRASSGAANYLPVIEVPNLVMALQEIKNLGASVIAADSNASQSMWSSNLRGFNLLILGSEARGVSPDLLAQCDQCITIPMSGQIDSLNVAVAAGILIYEIRRQHQS